MSAKKEEKFVIQRFKNSSGKTSYRVSGYKEDGSRVRKNFKSKTDAIEYKGTLEIASEGDIRGYALQRTRLTPEQLADAETALSHSSSQSLSQQLAHYQALQQRVAKVSDIGIESAIAFYERHYRAIGTADILGYSSVYYCSRAFKKQFSQSPQQWLRRKNNH